MTKSAKIVAKALGDAELVLLASGGKHPDHLIEIPETMKPVTRQRAAANLLKRGLAEERAARSDEPTWCEDEEGCFALAVTAAGLAAIGIEDGGVKSETVATEREGGPASAPREGSKGALLVSMLSRPSGASIDELTSATGWLPHTTRAALSGLRKRGFAVERKSATVGSSAYCIAVAEPTPTPAKRRHKAA